MAHYIRRHSILGVALILTVIFALYGQSWSEASSSTTVGSNDDSASAAPASTATARLIHSDSAGLRLQLDVPQYTVDRTGNVSAPGLPHITQEEGAPALPYYSTLIVLPPEASVDIAVYTGSPERKSVANVRPAPRSVVTIEDDTSLHGHSVIDTTYEQDPAVYGVDEPYPNHAYRLSEPMYYRDLRLVRLELFPLRYQPASQIMEHSPTMEVTLTFTGAQLDQMRPAGGSSVATDSAIAPHILNYGDAEKWRSLPAAPEKATSMLPVGKETFKIEVNEDGIYEIGRDDLAAVGMNVGAVDPEKIEMMYRGEPVAYQLVNNNKNGAFDANEKIR